MTRKTRPIIATTLFVFALVATVPTASGGFEWEGRQEAADFSETQADSPVVTLSRIALNLIDFLFPGSPEPCKEACIEAKESEENPLDLAIDEYQSDIPEDFGIANP